MFIRKKRCNKPLANILLVVFLFSSAFTQPAENLSSFSNALGCSFEKSKTSTLPLHQFPCEGTKKEEQKSEDQTLLLSYHAEHVLFMLLDLQEHCFFSDASSFSDSSHTPLYLVIKTLRL
jgi:hypothetical protein